MDIINEKKKQDILFHAERLLYYNELLISQCDNWLSAEEGNKNMMRDIEEKAKAKREAERIAKINRNQSSNHSIIRNIKSIFNHGKRYSIFGSIRRNADDEL